MPKKDESEEYQVTIILMFYYQVSGKVDVNGYELWVEIYGLLAGLGVKEKQEMRLTQNHIPS